MFFPFHDDNPTVRTPVATLALIAVNVLALFWLWQLPEARQQQVVYLRGFVPARIAQLTDHRPIRVEVPAPERFGPQRAPQAVVIFQPQPGEILLSLVTAMFLHGGWLHLVGNMWFLWLFGNNVEDRLGVVPYLLLYLVGGLLASASHWLTDPASTVPVIGASGAVAAVLGAYAVTWPWARIHTLVFLFIFVTVIDVPAMVVLGVWFLIQLLSGAGSLAQEAGAEGVAWWAHVGGFAAGMLLMPLLAALIEPPSPIRKTQESEEDGPWGL